jgi:tRNA pseudouridine55 synthase
MSQAKPSAADSPPVAEPLDGIINYRKGIGVSSRSAVNEVIRAIGRRKLKAGHAGTLDPIAEGVLIICLGKATRLIPYIHELPKEYIGRFQLGVASDSDDIESPLRPLLGAPQSTEEQILDVLPNFLGAIQQVPPLFSAVKVDGQRAYKLARAGGTAVLKPKTVHVHEIELVALDYPFLTLRIQCGTGTYIRSLARDIAKQLETVCVMDQLTRTAIGPFTLDSTVNQQTLANSPKDSILPCRLGVGQLASMTIGPDEIEELRHGRPFASNDALVTTSALVTAGTTDEVVALDASGHLMAIVKEKLGEYWPVRFFNASC